MFTIRVDFTGYNTSNAPGLANESTMGLVISIYMFGKVIFIYLF